MSTRSTIGIRNEDNSIDYIYCHWDGYLSHNGKLLLENYNSPEKVRELLALGDLSSLGSKIGVKHPFDSRDKVFKGMCTAYHRDREEKLNPAKHAANNDSFQPQEYNYVFCGDHWEVSEGPWNAFGMPAEDQSMSEAATLTPEMCE